MYMVTVRGYMDGELVTLEEHEFASGIDALEYIAGLYGDGKFVEFAAL